MAEKRAIVTAPAEVSSLQQAQSLVKKHKKLEEEVQHHQMVIHVEMVTVMVDVSMVKML